MDKGKLDALINLLDDPDKTVYELVEKELLKESDNIIPVLEQKWETSFDVDLQERIENLIQSLQYKETFNELKNWLNTNEAERNLFNGFLIVDTFQYPDLNMLNIQLKVENIRKKIWLELNNSLTLLEKTTILNHFLFNINGFAINHSNINSPQNTFLNQILDSKKGNPVSLSILYTIIARQLELPAYFIDFPKNPLIAIVEPELARKVHGGSQSSDVLFYINPSHKGSITSIKEIQYHLRKNDFQPIRNYSEPKSDTLFIKRLLESLEDSYRLLGMIEKEEQVQDLLNLFGE
ncbi:transglutaminase-like domain-containing protein [Draconibacterium sp.]|nr:transglutaminase-like domain-containing protein [Draconibacterium sp.]